MDNTADVSMELNIEKKEKLNQLLEELHDKAAIDYNNTEIKDIESAVHEMMWKIAEGINKHGHFKISRLQACGSMAEKVSVWKHLKCGEECDGLKEDDAFIEFDFLPILGEFSDENTESGCPECVEVNMPELFKIIRTGETPLYDEYDLKSQVFEEGIASAGSLFECILPDMPDSSSVTFKHNSSLCVRECCVVRDTGELQLNSVIPIKPFGQNGQTPAKCSLILQWKSKAGSLKAPNALYTQSREIQVLPIFIDFVPALESPDTHKGDNGYEYEIFVIPKSCNFCKIISTIWKRSMFLSEIHTVANEMTNKHRKCYRIIKLLLEVMDDTIVNYSFIDQYHVKTVVLHHNRTCLDTSDKVANCVLQIFRELIHAHKTEILKSFHSVKRFRFLDIRMSGAYSSYLEKLCSVSTNDSLDTFVNKIKACSI